jgi:fumarylacetoacetase
VPIGYHGRASSIGVSGQRFRRPLGQTARRRAPGLAPSQRLDHELELGFFIGAGNALGTPVPSPRPRTTLFGMCLLNDWSARDLQAWEYQPLGPFLAKNFASTMSPWVVTMEALAPFRAAASSAPPATRSRCPTSTRRPTAPPAPSTSRSRCGCRRRACARRACRHAPSSRSQAAADAYWTPAQLVAHHTVNGCNLQPGDLLGSGTLSGPTRAGRLAARTDQGGKQPITLPNGETRTFLQDGDSLVLRRLVRAAWGAAHRLRPHSGTVLPARTAR